MSDDCRSVADLLGEIYFLRDQVARMRQALFPFAEMAAVYPRHDREHRLLSAYGGREVKIWHLRQAADMLREDPRFKFSA